MSELPTIRVQYEDFHAYRDHMSQTLRVTGICRVEGGGVAVELVPYPGPGGINPLMLTLDLAFTITAESDSEQPVEWKAEWDQSGPQFEEVEFRTGDSGVEPPPPLKFETIQ